MNKVMERALNLIARRNYGTEELKRRLLKKFPKPRLVETTIKRLKELDYLDDEKFAALWIEYRLNFKPKGRFLIKRELLAKGVDENLIEKTLQVVYNRNIEKKELANLFNSRKNRYPSDKKGERRLIGYLLRRGFLWEDIKENLESEE